MKVESIIFYELPELRQPYLVTALAGWPDAAQVATGAVSYLMRKLKAKKFAELRGEANPMVCLGFCRSCWNYWK